MRNKFLSSPFQNTFIEWTPSTRHWDTVCSCCLINLVCVAGTAKGCNQYIHAAIVHWIPNAISRLNKKPTNKQNEYKMSKNQKLCGVINGGYRYGIEGKQKILQQNSDPSNLERDKARAIGQQTQDKRHDAVSPISNKPILKSLGVAILSIRNNALI